METARVVAVGGLLEGAVYDLGAGRPVTFGRAAQNAVTVPDARVSRTHCRFEHRGPDVFVVDLDTANGTRVNGEAVEERRLESGDTIEIGSSLFRFEVAESSSVTERVGARRSTHPPEELSASTIRKRFDEPAASLRETGTSAPDPGRAQERLAAMCGMAGVINSGLPLDAMFATVLDTSMEVVRATRGAIVLRHGDGGPACAVQPVCVRSSLGQPVQGFEVSQTVLAEVLSQGVSIASADVARDPRLSGARSLAFQCVRAVMCAPVRTESRILGAVYVDAAIGGATFAEPDLALLAAIGQQLGVALERAGLVADLQALFVGAVHTLVATIEAKDAYTRGHSERVTAVGLALADELALALLDRDIVELGGLLHDVGKIGVPEEILRKPDKLTDAEFAEIRKHPGAGERIVSHIPKIDRIVPVASLLQAVRHHHERFDGKGYPDRLAGADVPLSARILAVADTFDAIVSDRPYRPGAPPATAARIILENAGTQFDPAVVAAFAAVHASGRLARPQDVPGRFRVRG